MRCRPTSSGDRGPTGALVLCWFVFHLLAAGLQAQLPADFNPAFSPAAPGVAYAHEQLTTTNGPWSIHIVRLAWPAKDWQVVSTLAQGAVFGLSSVSDQVKSVSPRDGTSLVAVNGDFFVIQRDPYQGDPRGLQIRNGELVSAPTGGAAIWFDRRGRPRLAHVRSQLTVRWPDGSETALGLNEARATNAAVLYTPTLGPSTRTVGGTELVLERDGKSPWLPLAASVKIKARVTEVRSAGDTRLEAGEILLSLGPALRERPATLTPGLRLTLATVTAPDLAAVQTALAGGPVLVQAGAVREWKPPQPRHPRTALGWNATHLFLVVVDGRQPWLSVGMTLPELADLMKRLRCRDALNLDGGGSSTLWLNGKVVNSPSDGRERAVANGLVFLRKRDAARR